ncbi:hypothetical protein PRZ48_014034 [Zasmidium cellare]|uniref:Uncharacterized protein n=1 Tax=Zasmidium cellare TaxID=395010 RepID=A0ABR0E0C0_ZASCE|nr:hypothetical protein PRZ48_014034 [Zasmidium cellare]
MEEAAYETFTTPIVPPGLVQFPQEHLDFIRAQGYDEATHEPLQRYASDDISNGHSTWYAFIRTDSDGSEESEEEDAVGEDEKDDIDWAGYADFLALLEEQAAAASPLTGTGVPLLEDERMKSE